jgi:hypothetical protein
MRSIARLGARWTRSKGEQRYGEAVSGEQDWINTIVSGLSLIATGVNRGHRLPKNAGGE